MNNIVIMLIAQIVVLLSLPIIRRLFNFYLDDQIKSKRLTLGVFFTSNVGFSVIVLIIFLISYFKGNTDSMVSSFLLFESNKLFVDIGFRISLIQVLFYFSLNVLTSIVGYNIVTNHNNWNINFIDKISIFTLMTIMFIFSPNLFQLILFMLVIDVLFLDFISSSPRKTESGRNDSFLHGFLSIIISNILLLISVALLVRRTKSFDFHDISNSIQYHLFIYKPYFKILLFLVFIAIFAKISLIPFHNWFKKTSNSRNQKLFLIFSIYMPLPIFLILGTPFLQLVPIIQNIVLWFGVCSAIIIAFFSVFLKSKKEDTFLLFISFLSLILYSIGIGFYSVAIHLSLLSPFLFSILSILKTKKNEEDDEIIVSFDQVKNSKKILYMLTVSISLLTLIGFVPFNSLILSITYPVTLTTKSLQVSLLVLCLVTMMLLFVSALDIFRDSFSINAENNIAKTDLISSISLTLFLMLLSVLFPIFGLISPTSETINIPPDSFMISALPLGIGYILVGIFYALRKKYWKSMDQTILVFSENISLILRKIFYFEFIFTPIIYITKRLIIPSIIWLYQEVLVDFIYGIIIRYSVTLLQSSFKSIWNFIVKILIPAIRNLFTKLSLLARKFEEASLLTQFLFIFGFLFVLILIVIILFIGGQI